MAGDKKRVSPLHVRELNSALRRLAGRKMTRISAETQRGIQLSGGIFSVTDCVGYDSTSVEKSNHEQAVPFDRFS